MDKESHGSNDGLRTYLGLVRKLNSLIIQDLEKGLPPDPFLLEACYDTARMLGALPGALDAESTFEMVSAAILVGKPAEAREYLEYAAQSSENTLFERGYAHYLFLELFLRNDTWWREDDVSLLKKHLYALAEIIPKLDREHHPARVLVACYERDWKHALTGGTPPILQ